MDESSHRKNLLLFCSIMSDDLKFVGNDPGAVKHGNFINYYQFNSVENRIKLLPNDVWTVSNDKFVGLDIGCNSGDLTQEIYRFLRCNGVDDCSLMGIDLDPILISRAKETNQYPSNVTYDCIDFMNSDGSSLSSYLSAHGKTFFDAVFCFSVTMWIHLNHGDEGLKQFLKNVSLRTNMLIIEPQPWKCYRTAVRRMKRSGGESFPLFSELKIRDNVTSEIENILSVDCGFVKIKETVCTEWGRKLQFYKR
ncbi:putative RNA methyltransferase [Blattella germanica]|nr:putative RNA methyltransferase [Blattella germanica]